MTAAAPFEFRPALQGNAALVSAFFVALVGLFLAGFSASTQAATMTLAPSGPTGQVIINNNGANNSNQPFPNNGTPTCGFTCASPPNWESSVTVNMPQFDPSLGVLTQVDLQLTSTHLYGGVVAANTYTSTWTATMTDNGQGGRIAANIFSSPVLTGSVVFNSIPEGPVTVSVRNGASAFGSSPTRSESQVVTFQASAGIPISFVGTGTFPITLRHDPTAQPSTSGTGSSSSNSLPLVGVSIAGAPAGTSYVVPYTFQRSFGANNSRVTYTYDPYGSSQNAPFLPDGGAPDADGQFNFNAAPGDGGWFDPPLAAAFVYETDGLSNFTSVGLPVGVEPAGDMMFTVTDATGASVVLSEGAMHTFATPVDRFVISGISPAVDGADPRSFPTYLTFDQEVVHFTMTPVPEPATGLLSLAGLCCLVLWRRPRGR